MSDEFVFHAQRRERAGKGAARAARRTGRVPAVIYGAKKAPALVSIDPSELMPELRKTAFFTNLYDVEVEKDKHRVLVRDVQFHPVTDRPEHVDFMRVDPTTKVTVQVPVSFDNEAASPGIKRGGVLNIVRHEIEVVCLATQIPHEIRVDLTGLDIGDSVHIRMVKLPEGVRPSIARDFTVATVAPPNTQQTEAEIAATPAAPAEVEVITAKETKDKEKEAKEVVEEPKKGKA
ncbi:MAG TPA: 50S ribosomal protein L25/general stress protein Ctc [Alphaproteobacteria bacterium]|nr:50S ribosomal protein L25/general stress protein Ctc [Alphaproteobacteria bacterium]